MNIARIPFSASIDGRPIKVVAIATPGTLIHTALPATLAPGAIDQVFLWAANQTGGASTLTLEYGGVLAPDDHVVTAFAVAANSGPIKIADGLVLRNGLVIRAFAAGANLVTVFGYVDRIARTMYAGKVGGPS